MKELTTKLIRVDKYFAAVLTDRAHRQGLTVVALTRRMAATALRRQAKLKAERRELRLAVKLSVQPPEAP